MKAAPLTIQKNMPSEVPRPTPLSKVDQSMPICESAFFESPSVIPTVTQESYAGSKSVRRSNHGKMTEWKHRTAKTILQRECAVFFLVSPQVGQNCEKDGDTPAKWLAKGACAWNSGADAVMFNESSPSPNTE